MSRSSNLIEQPAVLTLKFKGEKYDKKKKEVTQEAGWYSYDKNANDGEGANVAHPLPLTFMWLENAQSFTGFNSKTEKGFYSNEILNSPDAIKKYGKQKLHLKTDGETVLSGYYADIKEEAKGMGAKFCIPLYAAMEVEGEWKVVRFLMTGASGSAWMSFNDRSKNLTHAIVCHDIIDVDMKTGDSYKAPVFQYVKATSEQIEAADRLVTSVDEYFDYILSDVQEPVEATDY